MPRPLASRRTRQMLVATLLLLGGAGAALGLLAGAGGSGKPSSDGAERVLADAQAQHRAVLLFRAKHAGGAVGPLELARLGPSLSTPAVSRLRCARVYFAHARGLCVTNAGDSRTGYRVEIFGHDLRVRHVLALDGVPSRARVSPDGRYGAVTMFVTGHDYAAAGQFSTETTLLDLATGTKLAELEDFSVSRGGRQVTAEDVNFWGVTFARDGDTFYATMATGGRTYLLRGSVRDHTARVIHGGVECPSLSPDGTRIAFKHTAGVVEGAARWRLTVLDLRTMRETPLAETRSVDDQAEWLDDRHVAYGLGDAIWSVATDGSGHPRRLLDHADSPAAVRP